MARPEISAGFPNKPGRIDLAKIDFTGSEHLRLDRLRIARLGVDGPSVQESFLILPGCRVAWGGQTEHLLFAAQRFIEYSTFPKRPVEILAGCAEVIY